MLEKLGREDADLPYVQDYIYACKWSETMPSLHEKRKKMYIFNGTEIENCSLFKYSTCRFSFSKI